MVFSCCFFNLICFWRGKGVYLNSLLKALSPPLPFVPLGVARNSDPKLTWSPGSVTNTSLAHELWKVPLPPKTITAPSRPPPGLTGQKPPLSAWENSPLRVGGGWGNSDARYTPGKTGCGMGAWLLCWTQGSTAVGCSRPSRGRTRTETHRLGRRPLCFPCLHVLGFMGHFAHFT